MVIKNKRVVIPPLCGVTEVALILEVERTTIPRMRKFKDFPDPITHIGTRPIWLESEILDYKEMRIKKKKTIVGGDANVH